ncbi:fungal-specific transcription factor domain-containing protein [Exophiala viscosa]|uniref:fungal-specific transcription factor domain-containing protein n=1 Tax=Exophiala viscosa TaxID=2486360 RepID=UPI0021923AEB|nr:fungal-specific transcription factor domain-containing protein [Exophiala viscosa]
MAGVMLTHAGESWGSPVVNAPAASTDVHTVSRGQKRKRLPRALIACEPCRRRKLRCEGDGQNACSRCVKASIISSCIYENVDGTDLRKASRPASISRQVDGTILTAPNPTTVSHFTTTIDRLRDLPCEGVDDGSISVSQSPVGSLLIDNEQEVPADRDDNSKELGGINPHTRGTEFYGTTGVFPFLSRLRQQAHRHNMPSHQQKGASIFSYLHNPFYPTSQSDGRSPGTHETNLGLGNLDFGFTSPATSSVTRTAREVDSAFIGQYFLSLHLIHPILEKRAFISRCERELWDEGNRVTKPSQGFTALYYAVLALGAIVASEEFCSSALPLGSTEKNSSTSRSPPLSLQYAKQYFSHAKANLGDVFEVSSLESTQAMFLLSVFCQNALKPHSCYLFSGMATTSAVAIGLPHEKGGRGPRSDERLRLAARTWWCIYAHEVEMSCASGRDTFTKTSAQYTLPLPGSHSLPLQEDEAEGQYIIAMVTLANILKQISEDLYQNLPPRLEELRTKASYLDTVLEDWKSSLPTVFYFSRRSLTEPERVTRCKIVLKLRYHSARILLYRRFVETWASNDDNATIGREVSACLQAARTTIQLLYDTYLHNPYFRTWWYNTTYLLNACMIALSVIFMGSCDTPVFEIFEDLDKALEVFEVMKSVVVARRCAQLTQEVCEVAKIVCRERAAASRRGEDPSMPAGATQSDLQPLVPLGFSATGNGSPSDVHGDASWQDAFMTSVLGEGAGGLCSLADFFDFESGGVSWNMYHGDITEAADYAEPGTSIS